MTALDKDSTKSISWLSLDKKTQEQLIDLCMQRSKNNIAKERDERTEPIERTIDDAIHKALGSESGHYSLMIFELEFLISASRGGVFDMIREYTSKYREIELAANSIAEEKKRGKNTFEISK